MQHRKPQFAVCCDDGPHLLYGMVQQEAVGKGLWVNTSLGAKVHLNEQVPAGDNMTHTLVCMHRHLDETVTEAQDSQIP